MRLLGLKGVTTAWDAGVGRRNSGAAKGLKEGHSLPADGQEGKFCLHQLWDDASRNNRAFSGQFLLGLTLSLSLPSTEETVDFDALCDSPFSPLAFQSCLLHFNPKIFASATLVYSISCACFL